MADTYLYDCSNNKYTIIKSNNPIQLVRIDDIHESGNFIIFYLQGIPNGSSNSEVQWFDC